MPKFDVPIVFDTVKGHNGTVTIEAPSKEALLDYLINRCEMCELCRKAYGQHYLEGEVVVDSVEWDENEIVQVDDGVEAELVAGGEPKTNAIRPAEG
jgi:hypothetical protein